MGEGRPVPPAPPSASAPFMPRQARLESSGTLHHVMEEGSIAGRSSGTTPRDQGQLRLKQGRSISHGLPRRGCRLGSWCPTACHQVVRSSKGDAGVKNPFNPTCSSRFEKTAFAKLKLSASPEGFGKPLGGEDSMDEPREAFKKGRRGDTGRPLDPAGGRRVSGRLHANGSPLPSVMPPRWARGAPESPCRPPSSPVSGP